MLESWLRILQELPLSKSEKELAARFAADPDGRGFLNIAEVLKTHQAHQECLELLTEGLSRHPDFSIARVVLGRELYNRGLIRQSLKTLDEAPKSLKENLLAQKLRFKGLVLTNQGGAARDVLNQLKTAQYLDEETKDLIRSFETSGLALLREQIIKDLSTKGVPLEAVELGTTDSSDGDAPPAASLQGRQAKEQSRTPPSPPNQDPAMSDLNGKNSLKSAYFNAEEVLEDQSIVGFQVIPLYEIFHPDGSSSLLSDTSSHQLDSATLGEIYTKQGHFTKALEVYKRLLRVTPGHDLIKRRIAELTRLEQAQKSQDLTIDPELVDRMETLTLINKKMEFFEGLIQKIDQSQ